VGLYGAKDPARQDYLRWALAHSRLPADVPADAVVINSLFHDHGHQFLFDQAALTALLLAAGFTNVRRNARVRATIPSCAAGDASPCHRTRGQQF